MKKKVKRWKQMWSSWKKERNGLWAIGGERDLVEGR